ncbi:MAG: glycosyltransferase family 4 protein [Fimbriimonas sp.]
MNLWAVVDTSAPLAGFRAPLLTAVVAMTVSWLLTPVVKSFAIQKGAVDNPKADDRRIHKEPIPRWGGLAIYAGIVVSLFAIMPFAYPHRPFPLYLAGILGIGGFLAVAGALDDLHAFSAKIQLAILLFAGVAVQFIADGAGQVQIQGFGALLGPGSGWFGLGLLSVPVTAIYIFIVTKTMDTIDGVDGLAAGIAAIAAATISVIATTTVIQTPAARAIALGNAYQEMPRMALIAAAVAGSALGFLRHNYNPAKIFMGTGGAYVLGFTLACLSIVGVMKTAAAVALFVPIFAFGVPIFDAFFVITRRIMSGQPITQADKRHVHHTLLSRGLNQRQTVWVLYAAATVLCAVLFYVIRTYA